MVTFTKRGADICAPFDGGGNARSVVNAELATLLTEIEMAVQAAGGLDPFDLVATSPQSLPAALQAQARVNISLGNVDNTSDANKPVSTAQATAIAAKLNAAEKGAANGVAPLGPDTKVPTIYLPSFVDDVVEANTFSALPTTGETGKIYVTLDTNKTYRWGGSSYAEISASPGSTDAVPEGATNLYHTSGRVLSVLQSAGNVGAGVAPAAGASSSLFATDITAAGATASVFLNSYYQGGFKAAVAGYGGVIKAEGDGYFAAYASSNAPAAGAALTVSEAFKWSSADVIFNVQPKGPAPISADNSNAYVTSSWVNAKIASTTAGVSQVVGASGNVTLSQLVAGGVAPVANPSHTGIVSVTNGAHATGGEHLHLQTTDFGATKPFFFVKPITGGWAIGQWNGSQAYGGLDLQAERLSRSGVNIATEADAGVYYASLYGIASSNSAASNTTALNSLISAAVAGGGGKIVFPRGVFQLNALATISGANDVVIVGQGETDGGFAGGTVFSWQNATGDCIVFSACQHSGTKGIYHRHDVRRTSGWTVKFQNGCFHPVFDGRIDYAYNGVRVFGCSEASINLVSRYTYGTGSLLFDGDATYQTYGASATIAADNPYPLTGDAPRKTWSSGLAVSVNDIVYSPIAGMIYQVTGAGSLGASEPNTIGGTTGPDGFTSTITNGTATLKFVARQLNHVEVGNYAYSIRMRAESHVLNGYRGLIMTDAANTGSSFPQWVYLEQFETDHTYWHGVEAYRGKSLYCIGPWFGSSLTGRGLMVDAGFLGDVSTDPATRVAGNWLDGIYCGAGNKNIRIVGSTVQDNSQASVGTYHGIMMDGTTRFQISSVTSLGSRQGYGVFINTGSDYFSVVGCNVGGNATGTINNVPGASAGRRELSANIN